MGARWSPGLGDRHISSTYSEPGAHGAPQKPWKLKPPGGPGFHDQQGGVNNLLPFGSVHIRTLWVRFAGSCRPLGFRPCANRVWPSSNERFFWLQKWVAMHCCTLAAFPGVLHFKRRAPKFIVEAFPVNRWNDYVSVPPRAFSF